MIDVNTPFPKMKRNVKKILNYRIFTKALMWTLAVFGVLFLLLLIALIGWLGREVEVVTPMPDKAILTLNLDKAVSEKVNGDWFDNLSEEPRISFYDMIKTIHIAAFDDRVEALVAEVQSTSLGLAQIEELRRAIQAFRTKGKKTYIYSRGMGTFGGGTNEYYLASVFDEIWMQPKSEIGITGISLEVPFMRQLLDKIGVTPEFYARYEYKNAMASLVDREMSKPYRSEMVKLGKTLFSQMIGTIAKERHIELNKLLMMIDRAPIEAEVGVNNQLVDIVAFKNEFNEELKKRYKAADFYEFSSYASGINEFRSISMPTVAYLVLEGEIVDRTSKQSMISNDVISARDTLKQIDAIRKIPNLKGVVVRVNSPGGEYNASAEIWNALKTLKKDKKVPLVVTMGDYAASGGYFIALAGDYLFAEPSTITGSIGVLGGKMVFQKLWKKLGVQWGGVHLGANSGMLSSHRPFNTTEKLAFNRSLDNVYRDFTNKVSESRKISLKELDKLARGRVWQGQAAVKNKLVDQLGGIVEAFDKVKTLAKLDKKSKFRIVMYPRAKSLTETISELISGAPQAKVDKILQEAGLPLSSLQALRRLQYDAALPWFEIAM